MGMRHVESDPPTSVPILECSMAISNACSMANLSDSRMGDTHALRSTSVSVAFMSGVSEREGGR